MCIPGTVRTYLSRNQHCHGYNVYEIHDDDHTDDYSSYPRDGISTHGQPTVSRHFSNSLLCGCIGKFYLTSIVWKVGERRMIKRPASVIRFHFRIYMTKSTQVCSVILYGWIDDSIRFDSTCTLQCWASKQECALSSVVSSYVCMCVCTTVVSCY